MLKKTMFFAVLLLAGLLIAVPAFADFDTITQVAPKDSPAIIVDTDNTNVNANANTNTNANANLNANTNINTQGQMQGQGQNQGQAQQQGQGQLQGQGQMQGFVSSISNEINNSQQFLPANTVDVETPVVNPGQARFLLNGEVPRIAVMGKDGKYYEVAMYDVKTEIVVKTVKIKKGWIFDRVRGIEVTEELIEAVTNAAKEVPLAELRFRVYNMPAIISISGGSQTTSSGSGFGPAGGAFSGSSSLPFGGAQSTQIPRNDIEVLRVVVPAPVAAPAPDLVPPPDPASLPVPFQK